MELAWCNRGVDLKLFSQGLTAKTSSLTAVSNVAGKKEPSIEKEIIGKKRTATSPLGGSAPSKKSVSRREELLKQLKAVEDAIARKRSKI